MKYLSRPQHCFPLGSDHSERAKKCGRVKKGDGTAEIKYRGICFGRPVNRRGKVKNSGGKIVR